MKLEDFDFNLPNEAIALRPVFPRDHARLLQLSSDGQMSDHHVFDLPDLLRAGDVLVINKTRVFPSALKAVRAARSVGGGNDVQLTINLHKFLDEAYWAAFVRPAKRIRVGDVLWFSPELYARVDEKRDAGEVVLRFNAKSRDLMTAIEQIGAPPLPPYIARQRAVDERDWSDYQTIYAQDTGSVAAPTAGLHFTSNLFLRLQEKGIVIKTVTLHVGAGTFLPVKTDDIADHIMHSEWYQIDSDVADYINLAKSDGRRIIAVGTTSLRALESSVKNGRLVAQSRETNIFITPGYTFKIIDGLMTNFHLPKSTLFMLVSAFNNVANIQRAYRHALSEGYRFYSYGDASLLWSEGA